MLAFKFRHQIYSLTNKLVFFNYALTISTQKYSYNIKNTKKDFNLKFLKKIFNKYNEKDLAIAIENNNIEAVLDILPKLPDKYFQYNYCTYSAIKNYTQIIEILLKDERCIPQNNINEPLMKSIEYNNMESFKLLISDIRVFKTFSVEQVFEHCIRFTR